MNVPASNDERSKSKRGSEEWRAGDKRNKREKRTVEPEPFYNYPESFLILLMGPDLGAVGEGIVRRIQHGATATPVLDVGRSDKGDPSTCG